MDNIGLQTLALSSKNAVQHFIVVIVGIIIVLIIVLILSSKNSRFRKFIVWLLAGSDNDDTHPHYLNSMKKNERRPRTELVMLVQKIDERRRIVDSRGHSKLFNEYYELVFRTRKGDAIHIITDKRIYKEIPFNQQGSLTFLRDEFIRFKTVNGAIEKNRKKQQSQQQQ